jgi:prepilin-type N-terminal cleavage/methylation domain-containing protein
MKVDGTLKRLRHARTAPQSEGGFTLIELVIVTVIIPIVVGALAAGLLAVFSLQSSTASRLSDSSDAQVVEASFQPDVQSSQAVTTESSSSPQCGTGNQVLGLEWNLNGTGNYQTVVSYVEVANGSSGSKSVNLVRQLCTDGSLTPSGSTVVSYDLKSTSAVTVTCTSAITTAGGCTPGGGYILTSGVTNVSFGVTEPNSNYVYTLVASPAAATSTALTGTPLTQSTATQCSFATPNSGEYADTLCFVNFSAITGANLAAAESGCLEMSVQVSENYSLYFCIGISGAPVAPATLPTYSEAFLGNSGTYQGNATGITPNYYGIVGSPALYQTCEGNNAACGSDTNGSGTGETTITITGITVVNPSGVSATGWEIASADAESTDSGESITWTSDQPLTVLSDGLPGDTTADPVGDACNSGVGLTGSGTPTVECNGNGTTSGGKTGAAIVEATTPKTMTINMVGTGLQAITFGMLVS